VAEKGIGCGGDWIGRLPLFVIEYGSMMEALHVLNYSFV